MDLIRVTFQCEDCAGTILETDDNPTNDSVVRCKQCGWIYGTFRHLKRNAVNSALSGALATATQRIQERSRKLY